LRKDKSWSKPVDGAELLRDIEAFLSKYIVLPSGAPLVVTAWAVTTYLMRGFDTHPILAITSPEKRCGKTRLLELLERLVYRPASTSGISEAALFRMIGAFEPTLLIDEAQSLRTRDERSAALHDILCAGSRRGKYIYRMGGPNRDRFDSFPVFGAKALAAIGNLSEILVDRAIEIRMRRRLPGEKVERFIFASVEAQAASLRQKLRRWTRDHLSGVRQACIAEVPPEFLADREAENWGPLFDVMRVADPARLPELAAAAYALAGGKAEEGLSSEGLQLLADIKVVFEKSDRAFLPSANLLQALIEREESPWHEWRWGRPLTARSLAVLLRSYGISPRMTRHEAGNSRGYHREDFEDVWARYLRPASATSATSESARGLSLNADAQQSIGDADQEIGADPHQDRIVADVTDQRLKPGAVIPHGYQDKGVVRRIRRELLFHRAAALRFRKLELAPRLSIGPGETLWRDFCRKKNYAAIMQAWVAVKGLAEQNTGDKQTSDPLLTSY
jgi:putative DNA primase/helicase